MTTNTTAEVSEARLLLAKHLRKLNGHDDAADVLAGKWDNGADIKAILEAIAMQSERPATAEVSEAMIERLTAIASPERRRWADLIADQFDVNDAAAIDAIEEGVSRGLILAMQSERRDGEVERLREALDEAFDFLGGCDGASEIRGKILAALSPDGVTNDG